MNNNDLNKECCAIESGMSYNDLKGAIESGMILHDKILIEDGIDLNINTNVCDDDGSKLLARVLAASNLLSIKYYKKDTIGFNNKFIATNKNIYDKIINEFNTYNKLINDKLKSVSKSSNPFNCVCSDIYIVDDLKENYVCVGLKDNYSHSYTFKIE